MNPVLTRGCQNFILTFGSLALPYPIDLDAIRVGGYRQLVTKPSKKAPESPHQYSLLLLYEFVTDCINRSDRVVLKSAI